MFPDDIPIQGPNADASGPNSAGAIAAGAALVSISEESENDPHQQANRNSSNRSGKDTPRVHKVPFPAFKKSKDKLAATKSNGSVDNSESAKEATVTKGAAHKKDRFANRGSIGISLQMSVDAGDIADRSSPGIVFIRHPDSEIVPLHSMTNGNVEEDLSRATSGDNGIITGDNSMESSGADDFATDQSKRISVVDLKMHSMQISQV